MVRVKNIYYQCFVSSNDNLEKIIKLKGPSALFSIPQLAFDVMQGPPSMLSSLSYVQHVFLSTALNHPKALKLLFRGSEHGFSALAFHECCDNIANTFTIDNNHFITDEKFKLGK